MKNRIISLLLVASCMLPAMAERTVSVVYGDSEESVTCALSESLHLKFAGSPLNVAVTNDESTIATIPLSQIKKISFKGSDSSVEEVGESTNQLRLLVDNSRNTLELYGDIEPGAQLRIYGVDGVLRRHIDGYDGSTIDIAPLPSGIYIFSLNSFTTKFIKK